MPWLKRFSTPTVEDLSHLLGPGWTGGRVRVARAAGGAVTITVNNLARAEDATGTTLLLTLPLSLMPVDHIYGLITLRGYRVRCLSTGAISIDDPTASLDYLSLTYVPKGGA